MPSVSAPFGLRVAYSPSGIVRPAVRPIASGYTTAIYNGDPVIVHTDGTVIKAVANSGRVDGYLMGVEYIDSTGKPNVSNYWPGVASATEIIAYLMEDVDAIYEIQANAALVGIGDVGAGINVSAEVGTGSAQTGVSLAMADVATKGTGTKQFVIDGLAPYENNGWTDSYPVIRVRLSNSLWMAALTTI